MPLPGPLQGKVEGVGLGALEAAKAYGSVQVRGGCLGWLPGTAGQRLSGPAAQRANGSAGWC